MSPEQADAQQKANYAAMLAAGGAPKLAGLCMQAMVLAEYPRDPVPELAKVMDLVDQAAEVVQPHTPCRKGCAFCCHQAVAIGSYEAELIGRYTGREAKTFPPTDQDTGRMLDANVQRYRGEPCPFLGAENECTIYPARPIVCRAHHTLLNDASHCDVTTSVADVPEVDLRMLVYASVNVQIPKAFRDIRDFFPSEAAS